MDEVDIAVLRETMSTIAWIILQDTFNDFSIYNRFPKLKTSRTGVRIHGGMYNREHYAELLDTARNDPFIHGVCLIRSINRKEFLSKCMSITSSVDCGLMKMRAKYYRQGMRKGRGTKTLSRQIAGLRRAG